MSKNEPPVQTWDTYGKRIRQVRRAFGIESRFMWHKTHWVARLWNWLIDAEKTNVSGIAPLVWFLTSGVVVVVVTFIAVILVHT